jgi:DNA-binding GntR family transcriptional regulator
MLKFPWQADATAQAPAASPLHQIRDVPLARLIREEVLASILRGELQPGQRITEPAIAGKLGVSRVPVREALRELESAGMVESRKHTGVFVRQLSRQETTDLYELRAVIDAHAGRRAAEKPAPALLKALQARLVEMDQAAASADITAYYDANLRFHWDIVCAAGNEQIAEVYRGIVQKLYLARLTNLSSTEGMHASLGEHRAIFDAIRNARPADCASLMANHVKAAQERLIQLSNRGDCNVA